MATSRRSGRELALDGLHLAVLWSFGVARPVFDVLADEPAFLVARAHDSGDIVFYALALTLLPPLVLLGVEALAELARPAIGRGLHLVFIGLLFAIVALQIGNQSMLSTVIGLGVGALAVFAYWRTQFVRTTLSVLGPAPVVLVAIFLFTAPISDLVFPQGSRDDVNVKVGNQAPVVVLLFDEFPLASLLDAEGRIDQSRYPNFAALADQADWHRNATTIASETPSAIPALLTGAAPQSPTPPPIASQHPQSIFTLLADEYDIHARETVTAVCPTDVCGSSRRRDPFAERIGDLSIDLSYVSGRQILPFRLADELPAVNQSFDHFHGSKEVVDDVLEYDDFIEDIEGGRDPALHYFHVQIPHSPWQFLPDGRRYRSGRYPEHFLKPPKISKWIEGNDWIVESFWQRHMLQVGFADRMVGRLIARLRVEGLWERALVVVAADHGAAFFPGESRRSATDATSGAIVPVPLFVKAPGQRRGRVLAERVCTTQIVALVAEILEISPEPPQGEVCQPGRVTVIGRSGVPELDVTYAQVERRFDELLAAQSRLFPPGRGFEEIYTFGEYGELVDRRVGSLPRAGPEKGSLSLDDPLLPSGRDREVTNAFLAGTTEDVSSGPIAVAIGGRIEAIGRSFVFDGREQWAAMVPPEAFARGELRAYRILDGSRPRLQPLGGP